MLRIKVENFSCIKHADLELGRLTVLVGPQASGKSVLSKLSYYFIEQLLQQHIAVVDGKPFDKFEAEIKSRFAEWFPVSAWGDKKFKIQFEHGDFSLTLTRSSYGKSIKDTVRLAASRQVKELYSSLMEALKSARKKAHTPTDFGFEVRWELQRLLRRKLTDALGDESIQWQTYVPAGRAFFTTLGRAIAAFEQGAALDPITVRFGRMYTSFQSETRLHPRTSPEQKSADEELAALLGGTVEWEDERPLLRLTDGRLVPFFALSSGQQELLPLVLALTSMSHFYDDHRNGSQFLYVEEPEAHLFPSAQSRLVQQLAALLKRNRRRLLITTHSPYVLSKINNLLFAGSLEGRLNKSGRDQLESIVPKRFRIERGVIRAYAIVEGELRSVLHESGLIDGEYLDGISTEIATEFESLLGLEP